MFSSDPLLTAVELLSVAFLFFLLIPVAGAFWVRRRWRIFRRNLRASLDFPMLRPHILPGREESGLRRFKGGLEAIEGDDIIWLKGPEGTVCADMRDAVVYNMTDPGSDDQVYDYLYPFPLPQTSLSPMGWNEVFSLTEGTRIYLFGELFLRRGRPVLGSSRQMPLTAIIYNEDPFTLIPRSVWSGRQSNEFWNSLTPWSLLIGSLVLLIATVGLLQNSPDYRLPVLSLGLALMPLVLFLPPGFFFFHLYRRFWDRGRKARAERDLMRLPVGLSAEDSNPSLVSSASERRVLYRRRPEGWRSGGEEGRYCYRLPRGLVEMAERVLEGDCVLYPAEPEELARFCSRRAFFFEALSWLMLFTGLGLNYVLIWLFLG